MEIRPRTLITRSVERVRAFLRELDGPAIIKPLHGYGGQNVFYVARGERVNLAQIVSTVKEQGYLIVQEYLPAVTKGDKRVLLLGGAPMLVGRAVGGIQAHAPQGRHPQQHARRRDAQAIQPDRGGAADLRPHPPAAGGRRPVFRGRRPGRRPHPGDQRVTPRAASTTSTSSTAWTWRRRWCAISSARSSSSGRSGSRCPRTSSCGREGIVMGTLKGSPSPPALWLRRAKPTWTAEPSRVPHLPRSGSGGRSRHGQRNPQRVPHLPRSGSGGRSPPAPTRSPTR